MSVGQLIYALSSGGGCLSDSEALNDDLLAREPIGVDKFADRTQVGESLREPSEESVAGLRQLLYEFVAWVWKEAEPRRLLPDDQRLCVTRSAWSGGTSVAASAAFPCRR